MTQNRDVLIVDDIVDTAEKLTESVRVLKLAGAKRLACACACLCMYACITCAPFCTQGAAICDTLLADS